MENCKYCNQELEEDSTICPHCGRDNAEQEAPAAEAAEEVMPAAEAVEETAETVDAAENAEVTEAAETEETAENAEETAPAEAAEIKAGVKVTPGKIALAIGAVVVLLAVLIALIVAGVKGAKSDEVPAGTGETVVATVPADGNPDDATCKGSYTVTDKKIAKVKNTVVANINGNELTNGQLQVHYWATVAGFLNSEQGRQLMMYGIINPSQPLDTQRCLLDETYTWQQFFLQQALDSWQISCGLAMEAKKANIEMTQEQKDFLNGLEDYLEETAAANGLTVEEMLRNEVGPGVGVEEYKAFQTLYVEGNGYYADQAEKMIPTEQELEAFFDEHAEAYEANGLTKDSKFVDVRHILVTVKEEETAEETTAPEETIAEETTSVAETTEIAETTEVVVEEKWVVCEEEAQAILDSWLAGEKTEESFAALANEKSEDPGSNTTGGLYEKVTLGRMVKPFEDWCFDESRQPGDYGLVKTDYGYHVMYFVGSAPQWTYFAERDWTSEQLGKMLTELAESYPMEVDYSKIALGNLLTD